MILQMKQWYFSQHAKINQPLKMKIIQIVAKEELNNLKKEFESM